MNLVSPTLRPATPTGTPNLPALVTPADKMSVIRQYLRIALRWRYVIIGAVVACAIIGLIVTLLMTPRYTATSTIEISREASQVTNFQGVERETSVADQEFYQTQYGLLASRSLARSPGRLMPSPRGELSCTPRDERAHFSSSSSPPSSSSSLLLLLPRRRP